MSDTPRTDAAKRLVVVAETYPLGAVGDEPYEAVDAETCALIERDCTLWATQATENAAALAAMTKRAEEAERNNWVPVSERLPAKGRTVLVYLDGHVCVANVANRNPDEIGFFIRGDFWEWKTATHWMPLPEQPAARGKNG